MMQMRKLSPLLLFLLAVVLGGLAVEAVQAGGWAVVTLQEWPDQVGAERPFSLRFAVRQHGLHLLGGLSPTVMAVHPNTGESVTVEAAETNETGIYAATLTLPAAGTWRWSIEAFTATYAMPPLTVQAASGAAANETTGSAWSITAAIGAVMMALGMALVWRRQPNRLFLTGLMAALVVGLVALGWYGQRPLSLAAQFDELATAVTAVNQGEVLFVAKGCIQCHQNGNVKMADNLFPIGPNLTGYEASSEFLRLWLTDPTGVKPRTLMPNLDLSDTEIETLIAFLNTDGE